jgi:SAM-dependent methyltransferase
MVESRDDTDSQAQFLAEHLPPPPATVLDAGCGTGRHAERLVHFGYTVIAVDYFMHRHALPDTPTGPCYVAADYTRLPIATNSIDAAYSLYTSVGYDRGIDSALREWHRVVRPGGSLILDLVGADTRSNVFGEITSDGYGIGLRVRRRDRWVYLSAVIRPRRVEVFQMSYPSLSTHQLNRLLKESGWRSREWHTSFGTADSPTCSRLIAVACTE